MKSFTIEGVAVNISSFYCPECGAPLDLDDQAETITTYRVNPGGMPYVDFVVRRVVVAACSGCEFVVEVKR